MSKFKAAEDMEYGPDWETKEISRYISDRKAFAPDGVHIPNKNEAKVLRKLMSKTGLSEKELREHKKYRKVLSEAQKVPKAKRTDKQKALDKIMKSVTRELKLAKEHPAVQAEFDKRVKQANLSPYSTYF